MMTKRIRIFLYYFLLLIYKLQESVNLDQILYNFILIANLSSILIFPILILKLKKIHKC